MESNKNKRQFIDNRDEIHFSKTIRQNYQNKKWEKERLKREVTIPGGHEQLGAIHPDKYKWVIFSSPPEKGSRKSI